MNADTPTPATASKALADRLDKRKHKVLALLSEVRASDEDRATCTNAYTDMDEAAQAVRDQATEIERLQTDLKDWTDAPLGPIVHANIVQRQAAEIERLEAGLDACGIDNADYKAANNEQAAEIERLQADSQRLKVIKNYLLQVHYKGWDAAKLAKQIADEHREYEGR